MNVAQENNSPILSSFTLWCIILLEGFVSVAVEILTIRQLIPVAGNSVIVTSLIIGIFLLFLALGYQKGGSHQQNHLKVLQFNFTFSAVWLGFGLSYLFVYLFFSAFQLISPHVIYPLLAYLLLILAPLVYVLGQTIPVTMNMVKSNKMVGQIGGNVLGLSTIGSFLGATLTSLVLMNFLGVAWTILINFTILALLAIAIKGNLLEKGIKIIFFIAALLVIYNINVKQEHLAFVKTNSYANYQVFDIPKQTKLLKINNSNSAILDQQKNTFPVIEKIQNILFNELKLKNKNILVLGAGGFVISSKGDFGNHFTYIDIDKDIHGIVESNFQKNVVGNFQVDDARHYVQAMDKHYDVIISDAYTNIRSIPSHLVTQEYFAAIKQKLAPGGIAIFNVIAIPTFKDKYSKRMDNSIRSVFSNCTVTPILYSDKPTNIIYVCNANDQQNDKTYYSDNLNTSTTDFFTW